MKKRTHPVKRPNSVRHSKHQQPMLVTNEFFIIQDMNTCACDFFMEDRTALLHCSLIDVLTKHGFDPQETKHGLKNEQSFNITRPSEKKKEYTVLVASIMIDDHIFYVIHIMTDRTRERFDARMNAIINNLPGSVYWKDLKGHYLGCNKFVATMAGYDSPEDVIGKTDYDLCWKEFADDWQKLDRTVIQENQTIVKEEFAKLADGRVITELSYKTPLKNEDDVIIGVIGTSLDISERKKLEHDLEKAKDAAEEALSAVKQAQLDEQKQRKEAERLQAENAINVAQLNAQKTFTKIANQVAHDIRSPLASLLMIVKACEEIPEKERTALRAVSTRINDIANNLLHQYLVDKTEKVHEAEETQELLLSAALLQLLTEKKFQYQDTVVEFSCEIEPAAWFVFISIAASSFKRMISNLVNNAVEALDNCRGKIILKAEASADWVNVSVCDTGKGMSPALIEKILNNMTVTEGKVDGNGIGLTQVRETLSHSHGRLAIHSQAGHGSTLKLTFRRIHTPEWVAEEIVIEKDDIIIILDDDRSIHGAWDSRFGYFLKQQHNIQLCHFESGKETLNFIHSLTPEQRGRVLLLTDYELLKQSLSGLDVIAKTKLSRTVLVTSHYEDAEIQKRARALNTKILPKQLASEILIKLSESPVETVDRSEDQITHAILVDDDDEFIRNVLSYIFDEADHIVRFDSPESFLAQLAKYPKHTKICLDNHFDHSPITGKQLAVQLHEQGYTHLYLISGDMLHRENLPNYITVLSKADIGKIKDW